MMVLADVTAKFQVDFFKTFLSLRKKRANIFLLLLSLSQTFQMRMSVNIDRVMCSHIVQIL